METQSLERPQTRDVVANVTHLVHECQLGESGTPDALPVIALCGWKCYERYPTGGAETYCSMCLEDWACPVCGEGS